MHSLFWLTSPHSGNVELDHARLSRDLAAVAQFHFNFIELSRYFNSLAFHSFKSAKGLSVQINLCLCLYLNCFIVDIPKHTIRCTKGHHVNLQTFVCWYYCFTSLF